VIARRDILKTGGLLLAGTTLGSASSLALSQKTGQGSMNGAVEEIGLRSDVTGAKVWFDPIGLHVKPGTVIRFINREANAHTATAYHPDNDGRPQRIPPAAESWSSDYLVEVGDFYDVTLTVEGVYDYYCAPHELAGMVGRIVVGRPVWQPDPIDHVDGDWTEATFPSVDEIISKGRISL
jgi:plastocyanin